MLFFYSAVLRGTKQGRTYQGRTPSLHKIFGWTFSPFAIGITTDLVFRSTTWVEVVEKPPTIRRDRGLLLCSHFSTSSAKERIFLHTGNEILNAALKKVVEGAQEEYFAVCAICVGEQRRRKTAGILGERARFNLRKLAKDETMKGASSLGLVAG